MRIVVTGGNGYIGSALRKRIASDENITGDFITIDRVDDYRFTNFSVDDLAKHFQGADLIVHLAAVRGGDTISLFDENARITENVMRAMIITGVDRLIFMSSIAVYSDLSLLPWQEDQPCTPVSLYGISKLTCESICKYYSKKHNIDCTILRLAPVYGEFDRNKRMIANFIRQTIAGENLLVNGKSESKRDFIYLQDAISALIFAMRLACTGIKVINIGSGCLFTNYEIASKVIEAFNNNNSIIYNDSIPENMPPAYMDLSRAKALGFAPAFDMDGAMAEIARVEKGYRSNV